MANEQDKRKYPLGSIYFYLTEGCNLRCRHCWIHPGYETEGQSYRTLDLDLFKYILEQAKPLGLRDIKLTGGEPLIHPQIREILDVIRTEDIRLIVETNGIQCSPEIAQEMRACKNAFISVSLDGADAETHEWMRGVKGCFETTLEGISNLVNARIAPQIIMSIVRRNKDQLVPIVRLAETLGAGSVKFNIVQPTARGEKMHSAGETLSIEELVEMGKWVERVLSASTDLRIVFSHPIAFRPLGKMFGGNGDGCGLCGIKRIIGVLADGSYALCGIGESVSELVFGHAANDRLEDVWHGNRVLREIREGLPHRLEGLCSECLMNGICLGNCIAQNYYRAKSLWAPYWYCEQAHSRDLFPTERLNPLSSEGACID